MDKEELTIFIQILNAVLIILKIIKIVKELQ